VYLDNERRPTLTPQLAVRVAILGGIALAAFAVIFFRLWFLQVLSTARAGSWSPRASAWRSRSRPTSCPTTAPSARRSTGGWAGC
jgi:cell division protein FtsI/penicillin-binding protein 2